MSDTKYKWIPSSTSCARCEALATIEYEMPPSRPHPHCQCTIVAITDNMYGGMTDTLPTIVDVVCTGGFTEYEEGSQKSIQELKEILIRQMFLSGTSCK